MPDDLRSRILLLVETYPGLHLREIQRRIDCTATLAEYHLNVLERLELVRSVQHDRYRDFFPKRHQGLVLTDTDRRWLGLLRRPPILALTLVLLEHGAMRPTELAKAVSLPGSTVNYQVRVAAKGGLLITEPVMGQASVRMADAGRTLEILQAYQPTPDAISDYASLWSKVFSRPAPEPHAEADAAPDMPDTVADLPPAQQKVWLALKGGPMTQQDLRVKTKLARRTIYNALKILEAEGFVVSTVDLRDTRRRIFRLKDGLGEEVTQPNQ